MQARFYAPFSSPATSQMLFEGKRKKKAADPAAPDNSDLPPTQSSSSSADIDPTIEQANKLLSNQKHLAGVLLSSTIKTFRERQNAAYLAQQKLNASLKPGQKELTTEQETEKDRLVKEGEALRTMEKEIREKAKQNGLLIMADGKIHFPDGTADDESKYEKQQSTYQ